MFIDWYTYYDYIYLCYVVLHYILLIILIQKIYYKWIYYNMTIVIDDTLQVIKFIAGQYLLRFQSTCFYFCSQFLFL